MKIIHLCWTTFGNKIRYWKKWPSRLRVKDCLCESLFRLIIKRQSQFCISTLRLRQNDRLGINSTPPWLDLTWLTGNLHSLILVWVMMAWHRTGDKPNLTSKGKKQNKAEFQLQKRLIVDIVYTHINWCTDIRSQITTTHNNSIVMGFSNKNTSLHLFGLPSTSRTLNIRLQIEAKISTWKLGQMISFHLICTLWILSLTHWDRDKMASIFQMTFSNTFSWMKKIYIP